jgi:hypothetical protein
MSAGVAELKVIEAVVEFVNSSSPQFVPHAEVPLLSCKYATPQEPFRVAKVTIRIGVLAETVKEVLKSK